MRNLVCLILLWPGIAFAQDPIKRLHTIFDDDQVKPRVLLLGVFHFAGEQVDVNTTPADLRVDMLSPARQKQIVDLVNSLAQFSPTKIVIEGSPLYQARYDSLYQSYLKGTLKTSSAFMANESVQLGFRLAKQLAHQKVFAVDAQAFRFQLSSADSVLTYEKYKSQTDTSFAYWENKYDQESAFDDTLAYNSTLKQYLKYLNAPERQEKSIGRWLVTTKRGSNIEPIGADGFITRYFNRNLRIYSNIQRIVSRKDERILVIYGATHLYLLKTIFAASPEFKLEEAMKYLEP